MAAPRRTRKKAPADPVRKLIDKAKADIRRFEKLGGKDRRRILDHMLAVPEGNGYRRAARELADEWGV